MAHRLDNIGDRHGEQSSMPVGDRAPCERHYDGACGSIDVVDNFPTTLPISRAELEVIETYFGSLLDELLSG